MSVQRVVKLEDLLNYNNEDVITRYHRDYPLAKMPGTQAFSELLKFIWLSLKHSHEKNTNPDDVRLQFTCVMHAEMKDIDNMWHVFLLFTKAYHEFCSDYLGTFFHHFPHTATSSLPDQVAYKLELSRYLTYIYDNLGEQTLRTWFAEYLQS